MMTKFDKATAKMSTLECVACWFAWIVSCGLLGCSIGSMYQRDGVGLVIGLWFAWLIPFMAHVVLSTVSFGKTRRT